jgi:hypothetical protein
VAKHSGRARHLDETPDTGVVRLPEHYGEILLTRIDCPQHFWMLMDELDAELRENFELAIRSGQANNNKTSRSADRIKMPT